MRRDPTRLVLGLLLGMLLVGIGVATANAAEPPSDQMLEKRGLKRAGSLFVLSAEESVHDKASEVRDLMRQLSQAQARQRATASEKQYQDTIKYLTNELNTLKTRSNMTTQQLNRLPKFHSRRGTYYANNYVAQQAQELNYYKRMLQVEINQRQAFLNRLKSQKFDPRDRLKADADVETNRASLDEAVQSLRNGIDEVHAKYAEVAKDPDVRKWLTIPEGKAAVKPKLGPSRAFKLDEKLLSRASRTTSASASDDPFASSSRTTTRKGKRSRGKGAAKSDPF